MKMTSEELGLLLGMRNPLWALVKHHSLTIHNNVTDIFWSIPLNYPKVDSELVTMHPTLESRALHDQLSAMDENTEKLLTEVDDWQRENILKALSEDAPEKFWMIFPTVVGAYIASGMLAIKIKKVRDLADSLLVNFSALKYTEKAGLCTALMPTLPDQLISIVAHLTNISESKLAETEQWIEESLSESQGENRLSAEVAAKFVHAMGAATEDREIKLAAMAVFVWRRATHRVVEGMVSPKSPGADSLLKLLSELASVAGRQIDPTPNVTEVESSNALN